MEQANAKPAAIPIAQPVAAEPVLLATWPRCVQITVAVLIALGIGYLLGRSFTADPVRRTADDTAVADNAGPRLDLNRATRGELALIQGLGPARAQSIEDYRRQHGAFHSVDDVRKVPGIGPKTLDRIRPWLFVDDVAVEPPPPSDSAATLMRPAAGPAAKSKKEIALTVRINVNDASAAELQKLPGVGVKTAQRILDERNLRGPFKTVEDMRRVPGIGPKTLEKLRPHVIVDVPVTVAGS